MQFSLRSLFAGLIWLSLILAVCIHYQKAATRYRKAEAEMRAAQAARTRAAAVRKWEARPGPGDRR